MSGDRHPLVVWAWSLVRLDVVGVAVATVFFCLSLTPSLFSRDWLFQRLIAGHGHDCGDTVLDGRVAVLPPDGWTAADTRRVRSALHGVGNEY